MEVSQTFLFSFLFVWFAIIVWDNLSVAECESVQAPLPGNIGQATIDTVQAFFDIAQSDDNYERTRSAAREYIRDELVARKFPPENVIYETFTYTESQQEPGSFNITTTTWTGINIHAWTNSSVSEKPVRVVLANYDSWQWGWESRVQKMAGARNNLAAAALLIHLAGAIREFSVDQPFLFLWLDQHDPGALGAQSLVDNAKWRTNDIDFVLNLHMVGVEPNFVATLPFPHRGRTYSTPQWLMSRFLQGASCIGQPLRVMSLDTTYSFLYQLYRYHIEEVPWLPDEGPFAWRGIPVAELTDYPWYMFQDNAELRNINDDISWLDPTLLAETASLTSALVLSDTNMPIFPISDQYVVIFSVLFTSPALMCLGFTVLHMIYYSSFRRWRNEQRQQAKRDRTLYHRVLFFHLCVLALLLVVDTVYACAVILASALSLFDMTTYPMPRAVLSAFLVLVGSLLHPFLPFGVLPYSGLWGLYTMHGILLLAYPSLRLINKKKVRPTANSAN